MIVNIHTHQNIQSKSPYIWNLTFDEAEKIFSSGQKGLFSFGFHPWLAHEFSEDQFKGLENWVNSSSFFAIGECGLDKNSIATLEVQVDVFRKHIELSERIQKPLIIHCVGSFNELFEIKKQLNPKQLWIIHGFRGKPELAAQALKNGCSLSFGEHFNSKSVQITPIDKLFIETDESNLPIEEICKKVALIKGCRSVDLTSGELLYLYFLSKN